ncbi:MAG: hypothetical protein RLY70_2240, partial [Planctomycetota bacterium]
SVVRKDATTTQTFDRRLLLVRRRPRPLCTTDILSVEDTAKAVPPSSTTPRAAAVALTAQTKSAASGDGQDVRRTKRRDHHSDVRSPSHPCMTATSYTLYDGHLVRRRHGEGVTTIEHNATRGGYRASRSNQVSSSGDGQDVRRTKERDHHSDVHPPSPPCTTATSSSLYDGHPVRRRHGDGVTARTKSARLATDKMSVARKDTTTRC